MQITNRIHFRNLRGDIFGGITAAVIALPMALTFGVASGAGASAGLWGAILIGFFAALFGGTPTLISEPTGPMIFGVAKAISREHNLINDYQALVLDLTEVPILGVTSSLALENAITEALEKGRQVFLVGLQGQAERRLTKMGVLEKVSSENLISDRTTALRQAVN